MQEQIKRFLKKNDLNIMQVYQTNFNNISLDKDFIEKQADGKSVVYTSFVLIDNIAVNELLTNKDIYYEYSGFETREELNNYILEEIIA